MELRRPSYSRYSENMIQTSGTGPGRVSERCGAAQRRGKGEAAVASWLPLVLWLASCLQAGSGPSPLPYPSPAMSRLCQPHAREMENLLAQCLAAGTHTVLTPTTALRNLEEGRSILRTGVAALDRVLRGGFPCRSLR